LSIIVRVTDLRTGGDGKAKPPSGRLLKRPRQLRGEFPPTFPVPTDRFRGASRKVSGEGQRDWERPHAGRDRHYEGGERGEGRGIRHPSSAYDGSSVFVESLAGVVRRGRREEGGGEGGDMDVYGYREARKNRPGQRARRVRFEAMQEALAAGGRGRGGGRGGGRGIRGRGGGEKGRGWGEDKFPKRDSAGNGSHRGGKTGHLKRSPPLPTATEGEHLHPSWAAKQALKAKEGGGGIAAFQGKKITFGEDD
jgi:hypothetical protein